MAQVRRKAAYHHGSLREALLAASVKLIAEKGVGAVSVREAARLAGVSAGAPYHHFPDRTTLFAAISARGFELLSARLRDLADRRDRPPSLGGVIDVYVRFAVEEAPYFQVMFRPELSRPDQHPEVQAAGDEAFSLLTRVLQTCQEAGVVPSGDAPHLLVMTWALAHGLSALWLDGPLEGRSKRLGVSAAKLTARIGAAYDEFLSAATRMGRQPTAEGEPGARGRRKA